MTRHPDFVTGSARAGVFGDMIELEAWHDSDLPRAILTLDVGSP